MGLLPVLWPKSVGVIFWKIQYQFYYARKQNASRVFAIVWASVRLSVCPSVRHTRELYQNGAS